MSFFDLENNLPRWLDDVIVRYNGLHEITSQNVINNFDHSSLTSYHSLVCAGMGCMVTDGNRTHQIWKFQAADANICAYGKYLEFSGENNILQFWLGIMVENGYMDLYIWFGRQPPQAVRQNLQLHSIEVIERREYYYSPQANNRGLPYVLGRNCGCGSLPLDQAGMQHLEQEIQAAATCLLDAINQSTI